MTGRAPAKKSTWKTKGKATGTFKRHKSTTILHSEDEALNSEAAAAADIPDLKKLGRAERSLYLREREALGSLRSRESH